MNRPFCFSFHLLWLGPKGWHTVTTRSRGAERWCGRFCSKLGLMTPASIEPPATPNPRFFRMIRTARPPPATGPLPIPMEDRAAIQALRLWGGGYGGRRDGSRRTKRISGDAHQQCCGIFGPAGGAGICAGQGTSAAARGFRLGVDGQAICGQYRVQSPDLRPLYEEAKRRIAKLEAFQIEHVLRGKNKKADELANQAMDRGMRRKSEIKAGASGSSSSPVAAEVPPVRPLRGIVKRKNQPPGRIDSGGNIVVVMPEKRWAKSGES